MDVKYTLNGIFGGGYSVKGVVVDIGFKDVIAKPPNSLNISKKLGGNPDQVGPPDYAQKFEFLFDRI